MTETAKPALLKRLQDAIHFRRRQLLSRNFNPQLLLDEAHHEALKRDGYVILRDIVRPEEITSLLDYYREMREQPGYETTDYYVNSMGFLDTGLRKRIVDNTYRILEPVISRFICMDLASFPLGGSYCISPPRSSLGCRPHQDPTAVDEIASYAFTIWIPLNDMTVENGCMHVIPGSHLWGNIHRSITIPWAFDEYQDELWKMALPVPMRTGDVLCFDVSTIHSSSTNSTERERLAVNLTTIPKGYDLKNYFPVRTSVFGNTADMYHIDERYFTEESQFCRPSDRYPVQATVALHNYYSLDHIRDLDRQYRESLNAAR